MAGHVWGLFHILRCELGKELVLLAWAIEDADPALGGKLAGSGARGALVVLHPDRCSHRPPRTAVVVVGSGGTILTSP